jgi:hypothetical protein
VLQDFSEDEEPVMWDVLRMAKDLAEKWIKDAPVVQRQGMTWRVDDEA